MTELFLGKPLLAEARAVVVNGYRAEAVHAAQVMDAIHDATP